MSNRLSCFVIMPYSNTAEEVYRRAVLPAIRDVRDADILALRADQMPSEVTLKARIESAVQSADFCIADVSGANPNVMYELGFAIAQQKPVVVLQEAGTTQLPANLSSIATLRYERADLERLRATLAKSLGQLASSLAMSEQGRNVGVLTEIRSGKGIFDRFALSVRHSFSAVVGSADSLTRDVFPKIPEESRPDLFIRVVCADPEGEYARIRSRDSGTAVSLYRTELWNEFQDLRTELQRYSRARCELRLTDRMITASIILSDDIALFFPYLAASRDREAMALEIVRERDPRSFALLQQQFGLVWADAVEGPQNRSLGGRDANPIGRGEA